MKIYRNFNLKLFNSYRLDASCSVAYFPDNEDEILNAFNIKGRKIIIGNGNNIILSKEWYDEEFIILNDCFNRYRINGCEIIAEAGATMLELSNAAREHSLSGFEIFYDIPGSVGGAVLMNAGSGSEEIKNIVTKVRYLDLYDSITKEISSEEISFEYRNSFFQKKDNNIILKTWFLLKEGKSSDIRAKMEELKRQRWSKQPREYPNCGSVFKRPRGFFVGPIIEELGLKGFSIGDAQISEKHAGFIINKGNATGSEIIKLIGIIQKKVKERYNIDLEVEQKII